MKIGLTGDYPPRSFSVEGSTAILQPESSWEKLFSLSKLDEELQGQTLSPLCQHLYPNLLSGNDVLVLTDNLVSKSVFLIFVYLLLAKKPFDRSSKYYNGGPRAIIVVPTDDRVMKVYGRLMLYKSWIPFIKKKGSRGHVGHVAAMVGDSPSVGKGDDIVIATPKGLGDFFDRNPKKVKPLTFFLEIVVVDRAEECCAAHKKLKSLLAKVNRYKHRQMLVFGHELKPGDLIHELTTFMMDSKRVIIVGHRQEAVEEDLGDDDQQAVHEALGVVGHLQEAIEEDLGDDDRQAVHEALGVVGHLQEAIEEDFGGDDRRAVHEALGVVGHLQEAIEEDLGGDDRQAVHEAL